MDKKERQRERQRKRQREKRQREKEAKERFEDANRELRRKYDTIRLWSEKPWLIPRQKEDL